MLTKINDVIFRVTLAAKKRQKLIYNYRLKRYEGKPPEWMRMTMDSVKEPRLAVTLVSQRVRREAETDYETLRIKHAGDARNGLDAKV